MKDFSEMYKNACELYRIELCKLWDVRYSDTHWVGDDVGGCLDVEGQFALSLDDIRYIVEHKIDWDTIDAWQDYNIAVDGIKRELYHINLQSWCDGRPRVYASKWYDELMRIKHGRN